MKTNRDIFIRGEGIHLRPLREADLDGRWYTWFNDSEVNWFQNKGFFPNTPEAQAEFFHNLQEDKTHVTLAVECAEDNMHIGNVALKHINWIHRTAEFGIVIGEKSYWGKGYGSEAWWLMTRYGFFTLNLNKLIAYALKGNDASVNCARRSGYLLEGELKEQYYRHGNYFDALLLGITASRWRECFGDDERCTFRKSPLAQDSND